MGISLRGVKLGHIGLDREILAFPHPNYILNSQRHEGSKVWCNCPVITYIIDHPDGRILWETGVSSAYSEEWLPDWQWLVDLSAVTPEVCLEEQLKKLKLGPEDFRYVIQGHLHTDHAGGLRLFKDSTTEILVHEDELKHVAQVKEPENFFVPADWDFLLDKKPTTVSGDVEIMKDVWLVSLPGHTPGTMGLRVKLPHTGWVVLACDSIHTHENYGPPPVSNILTMDPMQWASSVEKLRSVAVEHDAFVFPGHDDVGIQHASDGTSEFKKIDFEAGHVYE